MIKIGYIHKGMQGKVGEMKDRKGLMREIYVYQNSCDFPNSQMLLMTIHGGINVTERVPITEEIWQRVGECLGYNFKRAKNKDII